MVWVLGLAACAPTEVEMCPAPAGSSATCEQACQNLFAIHCRVGESEEECRRLCAESTSGLDGSVVNAVLACYAGASDCVEVDGCGKTCGPSGGLVPFVKPDVDAGGPPCTDDGFEENDDLASAEPVGLPSSTPATLCPADDDHYSFALGMGVSVTATATFAAGEADVQILAADGSSLSASGPGPSPRTASHTALADGTFFVRITPISTEVGAYTLDLRSP